MAATSNMFLYSLTIQPPTTIHQAILGQFSGTKEQQIITASGSRLSLLRPDPTQGKVITLLSHDIFGIIRAIACFRLAGSNKGTSIGPNLLDHHIVTWDWARPAAGAVMMLVTRFTMVYIAYLRLLLIL